MCVVCQIAMTGAAAIASVVPARATGDIMGARAKGKVKLDPGRRNYWGNVPAGCTDISQSALFGS